MLLSSIRGRPTCGLELQISDRGDGAVAEFNIPRQLLTILTIELSHSIVLYNAFKFGTRIAAMSELVHRIEKESGDSRCLRWIHITSSIVH